MPRSLCVLVLVALGLSCARAEESAGVRDVERIVGGKNSGLATAPAPLTGRPTER
jgi:hypothetical protein